MVCTDRTFEFLEVVNDLSGHKPSWPCPAPLISTDFGRAARPLHASILTMLSFLKSQAGEYVNLDRFVMSQASKMSDQERDALEKEVSNFGKICSKKIEILASTIGSIDANNETLVHQRTVIICLCNAVKQLGDELKALKAFRHQRASVKPRSPPVTMLPANLDTDTFEPMDLAPAELAELQQENQMLRQRLSNDVEALQAAERGMLEIGQMCEVFSLKVLEQEQQINSIYENIITSTVNVKSGDEELRKAEKGSALPLSFYVLLLVSFSLAFLHWYSR